LPRCGQAFGSRFMKGGQNIPKIYIYKKPALGLKIVVKFIKNWQKKCLKPVYLHHLDFLNGFGLCKIGSFIHRSEGDRNIYLAYIFGFPLSKKYMTSVTTCAMLLFMSISSVTD
jgi:hypothetical protein